MVYQMSQVITYVTMNRGVVAYVKRYIYHVLKDTVYKWCLTCRNKCTLKSLCEILLSNRSFSIPYKFRVLRLFYKYSYNPNGPYNTYLPDKISLVVLQTNVVSMVSGTYLSLGNVCMHSSISCD